MSDYTIYTLLQIEASVRREWRSPLPLKIGEIYETIAAELSEVANRPKPWGGGYIRNVVLSSQDPSQDLKIAVQKLKAKKDREAGIVSGRRRRYLELDCSDDELKRMQSEKNLRTRALIQLGESK
jgi:hypothetical protein